MKYDTQSIDALVDEIKGATGFVSKIFSTQANLIFVVIILGALIAINLLVN